MPRKEEQETLHSLDALFSGAEERGRQEQEHYRRLVENIKLAVARERRRHRDSVTLKYHVIPLSFRGFDMHRCMQFAYKELTKFGFKVLCDEDRFDIHVYWGHIVPKYQREALRREHGILVDVFGNFLGRELREGEEEGAARELTPEERRRQWDEQGFAQLQQQSVYDARTVQNLHRLYSGPAAGSDKK